MKNPNNCVKQGKIKFQHTIANQIKRLYSYNLKKKVFALQQIFFLVTNITKVNMFRHILRF